MSLADTKPKVAPIHVPFTAGTVQTATVLLQDEETGYTLVDEQGVVVSASIYWPDHPKVARSRALWLACYAAYNAGATSLSGPAGEDGKPTRVLRTDVAATQIAVLSEELESSYRAYAVALFAGWSYATIACTPEEVEALILRSPFVHNLVMRATDEHERFLPPSLHRAITTPVAVPEEV